MVSLSGLPRLSLRGRKPLTRAIRIGKLADAAQKSFLEHLRYPLHWTRPGRRMLVGPKYAKPVAQIPASYKEMGNWKTAERATRLARQVVGSLQDPELNSLEDKLTVFKSDAPCRAGPFSGSARSVEIFARRRISASHAAASLPASVHLQTARYAARLTE